jgi:hypothetical protein
MWLRRRKATAAKSEPRPAPTPAEAEDPQARQDAEYQALARNAGLAEKLMRDGTDGVGFSGGDSLGTREDRIDRILSGLRRS